MSFGRVATASASAARMRLLACVPQPVFAWRALTLQRLAGKVSIPAGGLSVRAFTNSAARRAEILYSAPEALISQPAPAFTAPAIVDGEITEVSLANYKGKYVILLFYPKDFTFVCPTEIIAFSEMQSEFAKVNTQVLAISTDTPEVHLAWIRTPRKKGGLGFMQIPIIADVTKSIAADYGVLIEQKGIALRGLFIIDPNGVLQQITINNLDVGRSVEEAMRLIQALQFVAEHGEVCPAGWKPGSKTMVADPDASLDYFSTVADDKDEDAFATGPNVKAIKTEKEYKEFISSGKVVVDFYKTYCGKCRQLIPFFNELADEYSSKGVKFAKFDITDDSLTDLSASIGVTAVPAFYFLKDGVSVSEPVFGYKKSHIKAAVESLAK